jgi:23S rRNA pseudouridine1911/1915/1917 synthase
VRKLIDGGRVEVNGKGAKASQLVKADDQLAVDEPEPTPLDAKPEAIPLDIVFEDEHLLVVDKPTGLVIHPAAGNPEGTLVNALLHHCRDLSGIGGVERPGIVHRLDKETTGLLVVAKSDRAHLGLSLAFRQRRVGKTYVAVCYGEPEKPDGVVDAPIDRHARERQKMAIVADGRPARTLYHVEEVFNGVCLVSCRPVTGRTHQIRVHMAHVGYALVGDPLYAGRQWRGLAGESAKIACRKFPRQALHAARLEFEHPVTKEDVEYEAPLPADIVQLLEVLRTEK